jgi:hypothetical protein
MPDYYQLFNVESVQKDEAAILEVLAAIRNRTLNNDLMLLNYYKEIPVLFPATPVFADQHLAELTVHPSQAVAMQVQRMTFLKSGHLPHAVVANVERVNLDKNQAIVSRFGYAQIRSERRECVRVKVVDDVDVVFRCESLRLEGKVRDISLSGLSFVAAEGPEAGEIEGEATIYLGESTVKVEALLLRGVRRESGTTYLLRLNPGPRAESAIGQFIFRQQSEIIRELRGRG